MFHIQRIADTVADGGVAVGMDDDDGGLRGIQGQGKGCACKEVFDLHVRIQDSNSYPREASNINA